MQFVSPYFAFTYLIKHKHETCEQSLEISRDNSYLTPNEQVKEPVIKVESKYFPTEGDIYLLSQWVG